MLKVFMPPIKKNEELIERMVELAAIARKDGMMALEGQEVPDKFFSKGMQMLVDGADETKLADQMNQEIKAMKLAMRRARTSSSHMWTLHRPWAWLARYRPCVHVGQYG